MLLREKQTVYAPQSFQAAPQSDYRYLGRRAPTIFQTLLGVSLGRRILRDAS